MRTLSIATLAVCILASMGITNPRDDVRPPRNDSDYTAVRAEVLDVERMAFPYSRLKLRITESSKPGMLDASAGSREITAESYFWTSKGRVDLMDPRNIGSLGACYLLQGDAIHAKLFPGSVRGDRWRVYGIERSPCVAPRAYTENVKVLDDLELMLDTDENSYVHGEPVRMQLTVTNTGDVPKVLQFSSGQRYDFAVTRDGREVWRWSAGMAFIQALGSVTIQPGETLTYDETWRQEDDKGRQVLPGEYRIFGTLTTMGREKPTVGPVAVHVQESRTEPDRYN